MKYQEVPFFFPCGEDSLMGIVAMPDQPGPLGVVVVVGGPQYRIGSHRQFVHLSRHLAARGVACLRFDYRGMGDSTGAIRTFEHVQPDMRAAVDALLARLPRLEGVILWGLCDGASAASFYAHTDPRVAGLVLLNPWVRTEQSEAMTYLRHYYLRRVFERSFWTKVFGGSFQPREAARSLLRSVAAAWRPGTVAQPRELRESVEPKHATSGGAGSLPSRMAAALSRFHGRILIILSGNDYTAAEFKDVASACHEWKSVLAGPNVAQKQIDASDHTFSKKEWTGQVATLTSEWISNLDLTTAPSLSLPRERGRVGVGVDENSV